MIDCNKIIDDFCREHHLQIAFSTQMPQGYESANGTFDIAKNTLFFNARQLSAEPEYAELFYLFHELRHAMQYTQPQLFGEAIRKSIDYVLMYDGTCFKMVQGDWREWKLQGTEAYLKDAYLGQPYEMDANRFAYEEVKKICAPSRELEELYSFWVPEKCLSDAEYMELYKAIDQKIAE